MGRPSSRAVSKPFGDDNLYIQERLLPRSATRRAAGQLRHPGDEGVIFGAPVQDDFVFRHDPPPASLN